MAKEREILNSVVPLDFTYNYRVGIPLEKYILGLAEGKLLGVACPSCKKVVTPPRSICGICNEKLDEWVEVGPEGTVENWTIGHVRLEKGEAKDNDEPVLIGMIKLDGATSLMPGLIEGMRPEELAAGARVRAVFKAEPEGSVRDLDHFEPA